MTIMKPDRRISNKQPNKNIKKVIFSFVFILLIYLIISLLICAFMFVVELPHTSFYFIAMISIALSSFFSGVTVGKIYKINGLINGILFNLPFILIILVVSLSLNNFQFDYKAAITLLVMLLSSAGGGVFAVNPSRKKR